MSKSSLSTGPEGSGLAAPDVAGADAHALRRIGVGLMIVGVFLFAINDTVAKWLLGSYGVGQVLLIRTLGCLLILGPMIWRAGAKPFRTAPRPGLQILRALLSALEVAMFYIAVIWLPLADAITFYMAGPIYVAVLATVFLGERSDWRRWLVIGAGFLGVVIALNPTGASFSWPALIALAGSVLFACSMTLTRYLRGTADVTLVTGTVLGSALLGVIALPFGGWSAPTPGDALLMCGLGVIALLGHFSVNRSLIVAPATVVVPYQYLLIVFGIALGWMVFGEEPRLNAIIGAGVIVVAGLVLFMYERRPGAAAIVDPPA